MLKLLFRQAGPEGLKTGVGGHAAEHSDSDNPELGIFAKDG